MSQKCDGNMIFTDYWKVLVLIFLRTENKVSFWAKKLMERWYLPITKKFSFLTFRWSEIWSILSQNVNGRMISTDYWKVHVSNFLVIKNIVFFSAKKLMGRWYLLGLFELSMIFQDLGNMVFRVMLRKSTWKKYFIVYYWDI